MKINDTVRASIPQRVQKRNPMMLIGQRAAVLSGHDLSPGSGYQRRDAASHTTSVLERVWYLVHVHYRLIKSTSNVRD